MNIMSKLTQLLLKELINYDPDTGKFSRMQFLPLSDDDKDRCNKEGHLFIYIEGTYYSARRIAWLYMTGEFPTGNIYSKSVDKGDFRWCNLTVNIKETVRKPPKTSPHNKSGTTGIHYDAKKDRWIAAICRNGVNKYIGTFKDKDDAIAARMSAEEELLNTEISFM